LRRENHETMFVAVARVVVHVPHARSLKDRRQVANKLKDRIRSRLPVSVCELGDAERHQLIELGCCTVARDRGTSEQALAQIRRLAEGLGEGQVTDYGSQILGFGRGGAMLGSDFERAADVGAVKGEAEDDGD